LYYLKQTSVPEKEKGERGKKKGEENMGERLRKNDDKVS